MFSHILKYIERLVNSPIIFVFGVITALTTLWGLVSIFKDLKEFFGLNIATGVILGIIFFCVSTIFSIFFIRLWKWTLFIPLNTKIGYIHTDVNRDWIIDDNGNGILKQERTFLFIKPPEKEDLADTVFSSECLSLEDLNQKSNDCKYIDHTEIASGVHRVYWEPKNGEIKVAEPYIHKTEHFFPFSGLNNPDFKCMTLPFDTHTIKFQLTITSHIDVKELKVFRGNRFFKLKEAKKIADRALKVRRKKAPLPNKLEKNKYTWIVENVTPGTTYFIVIYF